MSICSKTKKRILIVIISVIVALGFAGGCYYAYQYNKYYNIDLLTDDQLKEAGIKEFKKLIIVAHPDDETLWAGAHMAEDDYFIVCVTNGNNNVRSKEFKSILEASKDKGVILSYPDKAFGKRDDWNNVKENIIDDLTKIIEGNDWEHIVTHNPDGEYGHQHHIMINEFVTDIYTNLKIEGELYYFGKYSKKTDIDEANKDVEKISDEALQKKEELLKLYKSQAKTVDKLSHMNPYEDWTLFVR